MNVIMNIIKKIFERTEIVFFVALLAALLIPVNMSAWKLSIEIALGVVMFFSIRPFFRHEFNVHKNIKHVITSIVFNYVLLSAVYLIAAWFIIGTQNEYFIGYVLIAIVPPAISIIPLCYLTQCDAESADAAIFVSYAIAIILIPLALFIIFKKSFDFLILIKIILILIIIPMLAAWASAKSKNNLFNYTKSITNSCLGFIIFISIEINRHIFLDFNNPTLVRIYLIDFIAIFVLGAIVYTLSRMSTSHNEAINYSLYASQKNVGTAITLAIVLFHEYAAVPAIIALILQYIYFILLEKVLIPLHINSGEQKNT